MTDPNPAPAGHEVTVFLGPQLAPVLRAMLVRIDIARDKNLTGASREILEGMLLAISQDLHDLLAEVSE